MRDLEYILCCISIQRLEDIEDTPQIDRLRPTPTLGGHWPGRWRISRGARCVSGGFLPSTWSLATDFRLLTTPHLARQERQRVEGSNSEGSKEGSLRGKLTE